MPSKTMPRPNRPAAVRCGPFSFVGNVPCSGSRCCPERYCHQLLKTNDALRANGFTVTVA